MTSDEFLKLKESIESKYRDDMAAIERVWALYHPGEPAPESPFLSGAAGEEGIPEMSERGARVRRLRADAGKPRVKKGGKKLGWARFRARKAGVKDVEALTPEELQKYMVAGPIAAGGNGEE